MLLLFLRTGLDFLAYLSIDPFIAISLLLQEKIFRRKRLSTGANFVHVYLEIWTKVY